MTFYLALLMETILVSNVVLAQFLGICPFLGLSRKLDSAIGMGVSVTLVLILATAATWPIYTHFLEPNGLGYLQTLVFILIIAALVQLLETLLKKYIPSLYTAMGVYLPLITTNCAVLGVTLNAIAFGYGFGTSLVYAFGIGVGFLLAMVLFAGVRSKMEDANIPQTFQGTPIVLLAASIVSMAFMGFSGVAEGMFGL
jgi:electron transport complex protein RnfA